MAHKTVQQATSGLRRGAIREAMCWAEARRLAAEAEERETFRRTSTVKALQVAEMTPRQIYAQARTIFEMARGDGAKRNILAADLKDAADIAKHPLSKSLIHAIADALENGSADSLERKLREIASQK